MKFPVKRARVLYVVLNVCRIILALTFIFSGFVKAVDPWGTGIKIGEYLAAFDMDRLYGWRFGIGIWLNGAELMMGLMLLFKIRLRLISIFAAVSMLFFTALTLVLAIWNPVEDCGCFGEAIKLTNWATFIKNLILLPMSLAVLWGARKMPVMPTWRDGAFMLLFGWIAFGIGAYSYHHLPLIDFLPYKKGTDLREEIKAQSEDDVETVVIYRNILTGKEQEFELTDTTWYDESRWEYVDTKNTAIKSSVHASVRDFAIFDNESFITDKVLDYPGVTYIVCASDLHDIKQKCGHKLGIAVQQAMSRHYNVICVTAASLDKYPQVILDGLPVPCYNMDATTIKTILRAKVGVLVLKDGVIMDKVNCRDMLERGELPDY